MTDRPTIAAMPPENPTFIPPDLSRSLVYPTSVPMSHSPDHQTATGCPGQSGTLQRGSVADVRRRLAARNRSLRQYDTTHRMVKHLPQVVIQLVMVAHTCSHTDGPANRHLSAVSVIMNRFFADESHPETV